MTFTGPSAFACMHDKFPAERFFLQYPEGIKKPAISTLYGFFVLPRNLKPRHWDVNARFIDQYKDRKHVVQFHLCFRKRKPDKYYKKAMRNIDSFLCDHAVANTRVIISPILEANSGISDKDFKNLVRLIKKEMPARKFKIAISSLRKDRIKVRGMEEKHGVNPNFFKGKRSRLYNPDGTMVDFGNGYKNKNKMSPQQWKNRRNSNAISFCWCPGAQGLQNINNSADAKPPSQRKYEITDKTISGMLKIL